MERALRHGISRLTSIAVCGVLIASQAWAAQSAPHLAPQRFGNVAVNQPASGQPARQLDLRLPTMMASVGKMSEGFPSMSHHAAQDTNGSLRAALPSLGASMSQRIPSKAEVLVKNFRREGLPLAKLWQNQDSLVHLGLNSKGKPGLWLIQKIH